MDRKIIIAIIVVSILALGFMVYRLLLKKDEKVEVFYVAQNIVNNQIYVDSVIYFSDNTPNAKEWKWNFGDKQSDFGKEVKHKFALPGSYRITLTVTTDHGIGIDSSKIISVLARNFVADTIKKTDTPKVVLPSPARTVAPSVSNPPKKNLPKKVNRSKPKIFHERQPETRNDEDF